MVSFSGLIFLLHHSEISTTLIHALRGANDMNKEDCVPLRYAYVLMSKGFACGPQEVATIVEMHLRVVSSISLLSLSLFSYSFLIPLMFLVSIHYRSVTNLV